MDTETVVWTDPSPRQEWWEAVMARCGTGSVSDRSGRDTAPGNTGPRTTVIRN